MDLGFDRMTPRSAESANRGGASPEWEKRESEHEIAEFQTVTRIKVSGTLFSSRTGTSPSRWRRSFAFAGLVVPDQRERIRGKKDPERLGRRILQRAQGAIRVTPVDDSENRDRRADHAVQHPKVARPEAVQRWSVAFQFLGAWTGRERITGQRRDIVDHLQPHPDREAVHIRNRAVGEDDPEVRQLASGVWRRPSRGA